MRMLEEALKVDVGEPSTLGCIEVVRLLLSFHPIMRTCAFDEGVSGVGEDICFMILAFDFQLQPLTQTLKAIHGQ